MTRTGWILLFILAAVCIAATLQKEHMATASGYTLGPSTNVGDTAYADLLKQDTGQDVSSSAADTGQDASPTTPTCPPGSTFRDGCACCVGSSGPSAAICPDGYGLNQRTGKCEAGATPLTGEYWKQESPPPPPPGVVMKRTASKPKPQRMPPPAYTPTGTPAQVTPAALTGLQVGGPNSGGIGPSSGTPGNASWGGSGVKYPNLLGPNNKESNLPDNNATATLTLPSPCQVGADGNTLYSPGCRAPTDLGYFTLPSIPKTEGDPSPFSGDYTVFMK